MRKKKEGEESQEPERHFKYIAIPTSETLAFVQQYEYESQNRMAIELGYESADEMYESGYMATMYFGRNLILKKRLPADMPHYML